MVVPGPQSPAYFLELLSLQQCQGRQLSLASARAVSPELILEQLELVQLVVSVLEPLAEVIEPRAIARLSGFVQPA